MIHETATFLYLEKSLTRPLGMEMNFGNNCKWTAYYVPWFLSQETEILTAHFQIHIINANVFCYISTYSSSVTRKKEQDSHRDSDLSKNDKKINQYLKTEHILYK